jgi:DNA invertase Pin-like site-specific DNA recombinase
MDKEPNMRLIGYARTSKHREDGVSIAQQEHAIRTWAASRGHDIIDVVYDDGASGAVMERPALTEALYAVDGGDTAEGIVVLRMDRLARELNVQEAVLAKVWEHGGHVFTTDDGEVLRDDPDDPMRTAMRQMAGVFAQLERAMIAARLRGGRRQAARQGRYVGGTVRRPFGQRLVERPDGKHEYVDVPEEHEVIAFMVERYVQGESVRDVAAYLERRGTKTVSGGAWQPSSVASVLNRAGVTMRPSRRPSKAATTP